MLLAKIGARKTFLRIMVLWAVCSAGLAAMTGQNSYYLWRFLLGASEAGLFPGILLYLTFWVPVSRRARFTALFMASIPIAGVIGGPLSGLIMHTMDGVGRTAQLAVAFPDRRHSAAAARFRRDPTAARYAGECTVAVAR